MSECGFGRPSYLDGEPSSNLYVANCGPAVGLTFEDIKLAFSKFGDVMGVYPADDSGARVVISFHEAASAQAAFRAWNCVPCQELCNRKLHIARYIPKQPKVQNDDSLLVSTSAEELGIPGIFFVHDFVSRREEQDLLAEVDSKPWKNLSKRRVQHYGYEFLYETRNVDLERHMGELPSFVYGILEKINSFPGLEESRVSTLDQLTVNEYPIGVGLSPHIDTHSAFDDLIFCLSLAGSCIMEFRKYPGGNELGRTGDIVLADKGTGSEAVKFIRKAIFLPPRSMLLMSGEGRYAWHHYIPHHKIDIVEGCHVRRSSRRVSFTFRKVRRGSCNCQYKPYCDSQTEAVADTN